MKKEIDYLNLTKYFLYKDLPTKAIKVLNHGFNNEIIRKPRNIKKGREIRNLWKPENRTLGKFKNRTKLDEN